MNYNVNEYNITEALKILDFYMLTLKNRKNLVILKNNNSIIVFNNNLKISLSKEDFIEKFYDETFVIFKKLNEDIEINTEYKKLRQ